MSYRERKTEEYVWQQADILVGRQELLLPTVNRRKLSWFSHVCRHYTVPKIILQGTMDCGHRREKFLLTLAAHRLMLPAMRNTEDRNWPVHSSVTYAESFFVTTDKRSPAYPGGRLDGRNI